MQGIRIFAVLLVTVCTLSANAGVFKIISIAPTNTIMIGSQVCSVNDEFDDNAIIHWDESLTNQAIRVICLKQECKNMVGYSMNMSKKQFRQHSGKDISYNKLISLMSKGDEVKEPLLLWPNDTISLQIPAADKCDYYCKVKGLNIKEPLVVQDNSICVVSDHLLKYRYQGSFTIEVIQSPQDNPFDTKIISRILLETVPEQ